MMIRHSVTFFFSLLIIVSAQIANAQQLIGAGCGSINFPGIFIDCVKKEVGNIGPHDSFQLRYTCTDKTLTKEACLKSGTAIWQTFHFKFDPRGVEIKDQDTVLVPGNHSTVLIPANYSFGDLDDGIAEKCFVQRCTNETKDIFFNHWF